MISYASKVHRANGSGRAKPADYAHWLFSLVFTIYLEHSCLRIIVVSCLYNSEPVCIIISFLVACVARVTDDKQTDRQTYNPSTVTLGCACAPRVNKERGVVTVFHHNFYNVSKDNFILSDVATHTVMFYVI